MTETSVQHDTFVLQRTYPATPARVFAAWSDPKAKAVWFTGSDDFDASEYELDFRVGGREFTRGTVPGGTSTYVYEARIEDIVPDARIIYSYYMLMDGKRISVSVTTVQLKAVDDGTRLTLTEHGAYLDGLDKPEFRQEGVGEQLTALGELLKASA
ncbi:MAG: SRPBCC family protein [Jatrophihabitantaceae bacterium]